MPHQLTDAERMGAARVVAPAAAPSRLGVCEPDLQWGMDGFEASQCAEQRCKNEARRFLIWVRLGCIPSSPPTCAPTLNPATRAIHVPTSPTSLLAFAGVVVAFAVWRAYGGVAGAG